MKKSQIYLEFKIYHMVNISDFKNKLKKIICVFFLLPNVSSGENGLKINYGFPTPVVLNQNTCTPRGT